MIFIVGHTFKFNNAPKSTVSNISVQEQIALSRRSINQSKTTSVFDARFIQGNSYKLACIQKVMVNEQNQVKYVFANLSTNQPDIDIILPNTSAGDEYVAAISGKTQELAQERKSISQAQESVL